MKLVHQLGDLELIIEDSLFNKLGQIGIRHFPNEFGGFLVGSYSDDFKKVYISSQITPKQYKGFPYLFERNTDGVVEVFHNIYKEKEQYYLGEWHTHPNGSTMYSQTDLNAMIEIAECSTVQIKNPILLILSVNTTEAKDYCFYFYNDKKLIPYE